MGCAISRRLGWAFPFANLSTLVYRRHRFVYVHRQENRAGHRNLLIPVRFGGANVPDFVINLLILPMCGRLLTEGGEGWLNECTKSIS